MLSKNEVEQLIPKIEEFQLASGDFEVNYILETGET